MSQTTSYEFRFRVRQQGLIVLGNTGIIHKRVHDPVTDLEVTKRVLASLCDGSGRCVTAVDRQPTNGFPAGASAMIGFLRQFPDTFGPLRLLLDVFSARHGMIRVNYSVASFTGCSVWLFVVINTHRHQCK